MTPAAVPASSRARTATLLRAPPFGRRRPLISETVTEEERDRAPASRPHPFWGGLAGEQRAAALIRAIRTARVGGEFWADGVRPVRPDGAVLRPSSPASARTMVQGALAQTDAAAILVSAPDRIWSRRLRADLGRHGLQVHLGPVDPWSLLASARCVHVEGNDPLAFLGLVADVPVHCWADGEVSGRGLTRDAPSVTLHRTRSLAQVAHGLLVSSVAYRNPFTGEPTRCEEIVEILADWRRVLTRNRQIACCVGMSVWKRPAVAQMLHLGARPPRFRRFATPAVSCAVKQGGGVAVWASRVPKRLDSIAAKAGAPLLWVEDGFLRSAGLGADLAPPCSILVDARGPHYAPDQPSELEVLLSDAVFDPALIVRAERLIATIVAQGVTKYGARAVASPAVDAEPGRRAVLVAGQVSDDQSVRLGGAGVRGALDLLARVRAVEPDAYILFKPHPDVEAGHRHGAVADADALQFADEIVRDRPLPDLLAAVDAVHVLTSLCGFEALLRGREVVVHGQPFYAGWGLTRDLAPPPRRGRPLNLAELVAGALILYPRYLDPATGLPCPPEILISRLVDAAPRPTALTRARRIQGWISARTRPLDARTPETTS